MINIIILLGIKNCFDKKLLTQFKSFTKIHNLKGRDQMDSKISNLIAKKLISEYSYLHSDDLYKKELISQHKKEFLERIAEKSPKKPIEEIEPKSQEKKESTEKENLIEIKNEKTQDKVRQLYRNIAKKTHPDKTTNPTYIEIYIEATIAHDSNNLFDLYLIANELDIKVDLDENDFEILAEIIQQKKAEINSLESSFIWLYINSTNEEEKEKIVDIYIKRYF